MAKKKAAKKAAKSATAPKTRPAVNKTAKPAKAAPKKAAPKGKAAARSSAKPKAAAKKAAKSPAPPDDSGSERRQAELYAEGVKAFQAGRLKRALELFDAVAEGPDTGLRHRAHVHIQICRSRTAHDTVELKTADDYYNYAVQLINDRRLEEANENLDKALKKAARAGYVHYAKAVVAALRRDTEDSFRSLSRAVELDPKHRLQARRDPDMASVRDDARIADLLQGDASAGDS